MHSYMKTLLIVESDDNPVRIGSVLVVQIAIVVHVPEVGRIVGRTQPPVSRIIVDSPKYSIYYSFKSGCQCLYRLRSEAMAP